MSVDFALAFFAIAAPFLFRVVKPAPAAAMVVLGGWLLLPVGHYPAGSADADFPYWIIGSGLPSDMLLTKAWIAPTAALAGLLLFRRSVFAGLRPNVFDAPVLVWCLWPMLQALFIDAPRPDAGLASLYLAGAWGATWLVGRACFATQDGRLVLLKSLALCGLACLPIALLEAAGGPLIYDALYERHPYRLEGAVRFIGYRPLGLFEHGNQYGIWVAMCALAALWVALGKRASWRWRAVAGVDVVIALASQSVGPIALLILGALFLLACNRWRARPMLLGTAGAVALAGAVYASGAVPIERLGRDTVLGRHIVEVLVSTQRGQSFAWRIAQDQRHMQAATARPLVGNGAWDWWRSRPRRPWGFAMLVLGQYGLIGLSACALAWLGSAVAACGRVPAGAVWTPNGVPLALAALIVLSVLDALLNSFLFFPSLLAAGALAAPAAVTRLRVGHA
ncbi:MAG TPA: hypothetical protein VNU71_12140 [Burkholderiaceae bacterium]|nr:hypothetical protein [Burkholderiaceae bacterium]